MAAADLQNDATGALGRDFQIGDNPMRPVLQIDGRPFPNGARRPVQNVLCPIWERASRRLVSRDTSVIQRQDAVAASLAPPEIDQRLQLVRMRRGQISGFRIVGLQVVKLPLVIRVGTQRIASVPGQPYPWMIANSLPAFMIDRAATA